MAKSTSRRPAGIAAGKKPPCSCRKGCSKRASNGCVGAQSERVGMEACVRTKRDNCYDSLDSETKEKEMESLTVRSVSRGSKPADSLVKCVNCVVTPLL